MDVASYLRGALAAFVCVVALPAGAAQPAKPAVERNVIYGMYSGAALLLDVYRPTKANGLGIVFVAGSAFQADPAYSAKPIKELQVEMWGSPLVAAGYTVFAVNHRGAPRFHYPAAIEDVQRAIRFVRANAAHYGIDPARLGGLGGSSGGNLISLAAFRASPGRFDDADPVERESATLQAIVLRAALTDLRQPRTPRNAGIIVSYMESPPGDSPSVKALYEAASPQTHVSAQCPPTLLIHGDADDVVPYAQSIALEEALRKAGVPTRLVKVPGGTHYPDFGGQRRADWPDYFAETVTWFDEFLKAPSRPSR